MNGVTYIQRYKQKAFMFFDSRANYPQSTVRQHAYTFALW